MHLVAIIGSGRRHGNTYRALQVMEKRLAALDPSLTFETLWLAEHTVQPCLGCRACFDRGEAACPRKDDLPRIAETLLAADGVIFATPCYVFSLSGYLKNLLDRLAYFCHRPAFHGKYAAVVTTTASAGAGFAAYTVRLPLGSMGFTVAGAVGVTLHTGDAVPVPPDAARRLDALAKRLYRRLTGARRGAPTVQTLTSFRLNRRYYLAHADEDTVDYRYFKRMGWLDPGRRSYTGVRPALWQAAAARLITLFIRQG